jgi:hypothetical protein
MTDQFKEITKVKVLDAMIAEGLTNKEAAEAIGIPDNYLSMIKHPDQWPKCPAQAWVKTVNWVNSGQTLKEYAVKHGKVRPDPENQPAEELHPPKEKPQKRPSSARRRYEKVIDDYKKEQGITFDPTFPEAEPDTARLKVCLDVEINLLVNGQKVRVS